MQKTLMALSLSPKSIIGKAGNQFNGYVSNSTHNQKMKDLKIFLFASINQKYASEYHLTIFDYIKVYFIGIVTLVHL